MLSNDSRSTLMSYTDHSAKQRLCVLQRHNHVLRHKTNKETLKKDNTDKAARAEP